MKENSLVCIISCYSFIDLFINIISHENLWLAKELFSALIS